MAADVEAKHTGRRLILERLRQPAGDRTFLDHGDAAAAARQFKSGCQTSDSAAQQDDMFVGFRNHGSGRFR